MNLISEYFLQAQAGQTKISMTINYQGHLHLLTLRMPKVNKKVIRRNLLFKFIPAENNTVTIQLYEYYPTYSVAPPRYPAPTFTHLFQSFH